jgi:hypothetical protein
MTEWYYSRSGKQNGPVSFEQLVEIARSGGLNPLSDLVWTSTMKDWQPSGQIPGIFNTPAGPAPSTGDPSNPYAAPTSTWTESPQPTEGESLGEIPPGSEPIDVVGCLKRGFDLTRRNFGMILLVGVICVAVSVAASALFGVMDDVLGLPDAFPQHSHYSDSQSHYQVNFSSGFSSNEKGSLLNIFLRQIVGIFLSLGTTRIGLNLVSGKEFSIGMLFGEGRKFLPAVGATILYWLMIGIGTLFFIVPGIYLATRFGQFLAAIVDRDLGVMESFRYSSTITTNNRMNIFVQMLLSIVIAVAGALACCVGLIFALPVIWLGWIVAYRWMQYGHRAALDHLGTQTPMLSKL